MIKLKGVTKYYSSDTSVNMALKNINLEFQKGEFVAITGQSGSGKSTLLNVISGMDTYEDGEMYYKGSETSYFDDTDWEEYRRSSISFIYQLYNLIDSYTALENVETVLIACEETEGKSEKRERRKKAFEILDKVGLKKWANHKAVHLSSGQKQRLGIARALVKNTDIIVADEPTGNLDVENGMAIMKTLHELSKEKLVIVVTHNFEQVQDYASRKIRLFDGEVAEDICLKPEVYESIQKQKDSVSDEKVNPTQDSQSKKQRFSGFRKAIRFVHMNRKAQPHRSLFVFSLMFLAVAGFFIMYGNFISNLDDTKTRSVSDKIFSNYEEERLIVRKQDGSAFSEKEIEQLADLRYVYGVDKYNYANEISCLYEKDEDYEIEYKKSETSDVKEIIIKPKDYSEFVMSASVLSEKELIAGTLPQNRNEVVLASNDKDLIGEEIDIYFAEKKWDSGMYLGGTFVVTGLIDEELEKPYFSEEFTKDININYSNIKINLNYDTEKRTVYDDTTREDNVIVSTKRNQVILVEGENLTGNQIRVSDAILLNLSTEGKPVVGGINYTNLLTDALLRDVTQEEAVEYSCEIVSDKHGGSESVVEVSAELLESIYGSSEITQLSVYLEDYAFTDEVIQMISDAGFAAISAYRVSAGDYDSVLVQERMITLGISAGAIVIIFVLFILVIYAMMKLKRKDFVILKSLGLKQSIIDKMNHYELQTDAIFSCVILFIIAIVSKFVEVKIISDIVKYYTLSGYIAILLLSSALAGVIGYFFHRHMKRFLGGRHDKNK